MNKNNQAAEQLIAPDAHRVFASLIRGFAPVNSSVERNRFAVASTNSVTAANRIL